MYTKSEFVQREGSSFKIRLPSTIEPKEATPVKKKEKRTRENFYCYLQTEDGWQDWEKHKKTKTKKQKQSSHNDGRAAFVKQEVVYW